MASATTSGCAPAWRRQLLAQLPNIELTLVIVALLAFGNLRGIREAGKAFAFPTYFFFGSVSIVITEPDAYSAAQLDRLAATGAYLVLVDPDPFDADELWGVDGWRVWRPDPLEIQAED